MNIAERLMKIPARLLLVLLILGAVVRGSDLAMAQGVGGYAPGVNPSNPQDLSNRGNPQSLTVPGASNPQDLVRSPSQPNALSPANRTYLGQAPLSGSSLRYTHIDPPIDKPARKFAPHRRRMARPED
jgi:hypothetical protein